MPSIADLADVKSALRVTHDEDDDLLIRLIGSAARECLAFLDDGRLSAHGCEPFDADVPEEVFNGIVLMVGADYEGDPMRRTEARRAAEQLWMPYRNGLGV